MVMAGVQVAVEARFEAVAAAEAHGEVSTFSNPTPTSAPYRTRTSTRMSRSETHVMVDFGKVFAVCGNVFELKDQHLLTWLHV